MLWLFGSGVEYETHPSVKAKVESNKNVEFKYILKFTLYTHDLE